MNLIDLGLGIILIAIGIAVAYKRDELIDAIIELIKSKTKKESEKK